MSLPDLTKLTLEQREAAAAKVKKLTDFPLPYMKFWNYRPCVKHRNGWNQEYWDEATQTERVRKVLDTPKPGCNDCGIHLRNYQRVGAAWLFLRPRALLADTMGLGKTAQMLALIAMMAEAGELDNDKKVILVVRSPAIIQWYRNVTRMIPSIPVQVALGTKKERMAKYAQDWGVLLIGPQMLLRDYEVLEYNFRFALIGCDDVDPLRNRDSDTAYVIRRLANKSDRVVDMNGTPLQKRLVEMYSRLEPLGGKRVLGSPTEFKNYYIVPDSMPVKYRNLTEFKEHIQPFVLRRNISDVSDIHMPDLEVDNIFLDLYPAQRRKYEELQQGVLEIIKETGTELKRVEAIAKLIYGAQICGGLASLGEVDAPGTSVKLDWIIDKISNGGDIEGEKVVIFSRFKNTLRALQARLTEVGIEWEVIWGEQPDKMARDASQQRFWNDPNCLVLMGTEAIEQSLDLQISRRLINIDQIMNPARMSQLAGRVRRSGSMHSTVFVHNLLTLDTQEERYLPLLEREQALSDHVWSEKSDLFEQLSPIQLMSLITG